MTAAYMLGEFCDWWRREISEKIWCKKPTLTADNKEYTYTLVHPVVVKQDYGRSGNAIENTPSILLSVEGIENNLIENLRKYEVQAVVILWSSGVHNSDRFLPTENPLAFVQDSQKSYTPDSSVGDDLLNFLDFADLALLQMPDAFKVETRGWSWVVEDDPEVRVSDFRVASVKFVLTEPIYSAVPSDADEKEKEEQKAESKNNLDALL